MSPFLLQISNHAKERLKQRVISRNLVRKCLSKGSLVSIDLRRRKKIQNEFSKQNSRVSIKRHSGRISFDHRLLDRRLALKISMQKDLDVAYIQLRKGKVAKTLQLHPSLLIDLNKSDEILGIEIVDLKEIAPHLTLKKKRAKKIAA